MRNSQASHVRQNNMVDKPAVLDGIRKSVITVLSNTDNYKHLISNKKVVKDISEAVFACIFKKSGGFYKAKKSDTFESMIENIMFNTEKVCQVEKAKDQIVKASEIVSNDDYDIITLDVLEASIQDKLDTESSKDLDFFESKFRNEVDSLVYAGSGESLKDMPPRKDLLYLDLILVAEGTNKNKDTIPGDELENRYLTLIGMPLVKEHIQDAIHGVFYDSKLVRIKEGSYPGSVKIVKTGGQIAVRAKAYIFKNRFPREAFVIKNRDKEGLLRYSVELAFGYSVCPVCKGEFKKTDSFCEHLILRSEVPDFHRIVKDIYFIGGAYTTTPAEKRAVSLGVDDPAEKEEDDKKIKSCVINTEDTGKVDSNVKTENVETETQEPNTSGNNGGLRMNFTFNSVEELVASETVNALIEAKVDEVMAAERDSFETSLNELTEKLEAAEAQMADLTEKLQAAVSGLEESKNKLSAMETQKKSTDAILDLQKTGYVFESDEAIQAFIDKISVMDQAQINFVVDLMKKTVVTAAQPKEDEEDVTAEPKENKPASVDDTVEASQKADTNVAASKDSVKSIRKDWDSRILNLRK